MRSILCAFLASLLLLSSPLSAQTSVPETAETPSGIGQAELPAGISPELRERIDAAVASVKPALVRIHVVETYYSEGRELKFEASGSGAVIDAQGHIITNHHVAGHAKQIKVTFADKREYEAELVGTDALTDIAIIKLLPEEPVTLEPVAFGDSAAVRVGDFVLAMGSPLALSQSVTLGIVSNTEVVLPASMRRRGGGFELDGENVGALVRWIGHDAVIFPGNSGGPLVNLDGEVIGINEISLGLGGAIPGNLARSVADALIEEGEVTRAWFGLELQPRLKSMPEKEGVLVAGTLKDSPAEAAGFQPGDIIIRAAGEAVDVGFAEQMPTFNLLLSDQPIGEPVAFTVLRDGEEIELSATPDKREKAQPRESELREWGVTGRDLSQLMAKELKRDSTDGVMVTSVRPGGPAGDAKPVIQDDDIITAVDGEPVTNVDQLRVWTARRLAESEDETVNVLTEFERRNEQYVTVVEVGLKDLVDPGLEVKKAWLPVETQVITRDIAEAMGDEDLKGFRVTKVYAGSSAEAAGLEIGDLIFAIDGQPLRAARPEDYEELDALVRQYRVGTEAMLSVRRGQAGDAQEVGVELVRAPQLAREMKKLRVDDFEFTARDISFFDKADEEWSEDTCAAVAGLAPGDLIQFVNGEPIPSVEKLDEVMEAIAEAQPERVVLRVLRGIRTAFIELEPQWDQVDYE